MQPKCIPYNLAKVLTTIPWSAKIIEGRGPGWEVIHFLFAHREKLYPGSVYFTTDKISCELREDWSLPSFPDITHDVAKGLISDLAGGKFEAVKLNVVQTKFMSLNDNGDNLEMVATVAIEADNFDEIAIINPLTTVYISYNPTQRVGTICHKYLDGSKLWRDKLVEILA